MIPEGLTYKSRFRGNMRKIYGIDDSPALGRGVDYVEGFPYNQKLGALEGGHMFDGLVQ
jgi:hypothetical protein